MTPASPAPVPRCVLLAPYFVMSWLYRPLITLLRKRYGTRFVLMVPIGTDVADQYRSLLTAEDKIVEVPRFHDFAQARTGRSEAEELELARENEQRYGALFYQDILQQERPLAVGLVAGTIKTPFQDRSVGQAGEVARAINGYFDFFNRLFEENPIDLTLLWPRSGGEAAAAFVAESRGILVTYPYTAKYKHFAYWSTGAFSGDLQHRHAYAVSSDCDPIPEDEVSPPGRPAYLEQSNIHRRYSLGGTAREILRELFFTLEFAVIDLRAGTFGKGRRAPLRGKLAKLLRDFLYYRKFKKLCEAEMANITAKPFLFFAFQNEPEFSVQARCKEFTDQRAIVRQIALALPPGFNLVIKEHAWIGDRRLSFYEELVDLPNVVMAHPGLRAIDIIKHSAGVASLAGTVTLEAALFGRRAMVFSSRSEFLCMPHVELVSSFHDLPAQVRRIVYGDSPERRLDIRRAAARFCKAIERISVVAEPFYTKGAMVVDAVQVERAGDLLLDLIQLHAVDPTLGGAVTAKSDKKLELQ